MSLPRRLALVILGLTLLVGVGQAFWSVGKSGKSGEVAVAQLPPEARRTLALIHQSGPFPYAKDGSVFGNREGLLPRRDRGYYREYTVPTPGSRDRGARRIIAGQLAEYWYTADHYRSFQRIRE